MRAHRSRYVRSWNDGEGAFHMAAKLTPDDGARLMAAVDAVRATIFRQARTEGRREPFEAYRADALVALADTVGEPDTIRRPVTPATVNVLVEHAALVRGHVEGGETCEIPGVGPIPVAAAKAMLSDCILKVLVTDGVDIKAVAHAGRTIPARLRSALEARDPTCVVPGCDTRFPLEIDHLIPFAEGGPTRLDNLCRLCRWHHVQKTHAGASLTRDPTGWHWQHPP